MNYIGQCIPNNLSYLTIDLSFNKLYNIHLQNLIEGMKNQPNTLQNFKLYLSLGYLFGDGDIY